MSKDLAEQVREVLSRYEKRAISAADVAAEKVAKEAVKKLKKTSPKGSGRWKGHYANKWKVTKKEGAYIVHNDKYQLTHLLENGHDVIRNGKVVGHVSGIPHIAPVEEFCQEEFPKELERTLKG